MSELRPRAELRARSNSTPAIARHGQLKKTSPWATVFKIIGASLAVVLVSGAAIAGVAVANIADEITTEAIGADSPEAGPAPQIGAIKGGFNILIVGSDTRVGQAGLGGDETEETGELNDVNLLLHVSEDQTNATAISFPRDMVVPIPNCVDADGYEKPYSTEPINVAMSYGGLGCVAKTVEEFTGLPVQYAGVIEFQGVINMSNAVGGVPVCINGPIDDPYTGLLIEQAGTYTLAGQDALAFLRSRHGVGDGSDLTRISSQQVYLSSLVRTIKSDDTLSNIPRLYNLANAALQSMRLSEGLANPSTMVQIGLALKDIPLERVTFVQYPGSTGGSGIYSGKVQPIESLGEELMTKVRADEPFLLEAAGDGSGSEADPNAPAPAPAPDPAATADPSAAPPVDNTNVGTVPGVSGQTAADYTCSVANSY